VACSPQTTGFFAPQVLHQNTLKQVRFGVYGDNTCITGRGETIASKVLGTK
jgi:hypothetical protein